MNEDRFLREKASKTTEIITADYIDTPYPYCLLPQRMAGSKTVEKLRFSPIPRVRTLLKVSTWDGRDILQVRTEKNPC